MTITNPTLPKQQNNNYYYFLDMTQKVTNTSCVVFALYATKLVQCPITQITTCINLIENWLQDPNSVKQSALRNAANLGNISNNLALNVAIDATLAVSNPIYGNYYSAWAANYACMSEIENIKFKLLDYIGYLLPKEPKYNNFNIDLLKQNNLQAYSFLKNISKLEDWQVTNDDLIGIMQVFDVLEEIGVGLDPNEFQWDNEDVIEKHKLLQAIRREF